MPERRAGMNDNELYDLAIVGGGINGAGIARDAAGRGLRVVLCERDDLANATSSASSKLVHGGLRYLERYEFRLVAEALGEREILLRTAPHIVTPLTFVLPWAPGMRPRWMLRIGLWLYDHLARRSRLAGSRAVDLAASAYGQGLASDYPRGFTYSDCWVDDARLVILNCRAAADLGADIRVRTEVRSAVREQGCWRISANAQGRPIELRARGLVNAAGPWVRTVLANLTGREPAHSIRLVKGSHIVTRRLYPGEHAFILQNDDGRVVLVIPYRRDLTLIGTTDIPHQGDAHEARISGEEIAYLCAAASRYFEHPVSSADVLWSYSGVRPLYDDGAANPSEVTRDYKLLVDEADALPLLSIYGGKITTYRKLAEHALARLKPWFPAMGSDWTATRALPGGDLGTSDRTRFAARIAVEYPALPAPLVGALVERHGTLVREVLGPARDLAGLGEHFGADLYAREVDHFVDREWARSADDVLWRRTKAGLELDDNSQQRVARHVAGRIERQAERRS